MKVAIACNVVKYDEFGNVPEESREYDAPETIEAIKNAIKILGEEVVIIEADEHFTENLLKEKPDFVFNIAEGIRGESREAYAPAILEQLNIPFSGSKALTQMIALNKKFCTEILKSKGISTAESCLSTNLKDSEKLNFPLIVKPNFEGSSKGINKDSIVYNLKELNKQISEVHKNFKQSAIIEEYLPGREFTIALAGNPPKVLPIIETDFSHLPENLPKIDGYEAKWIYDSVDSCICPAKIDEDLKKKLEEISINAFHAINCVDFCRIDIRTDKFGEPKIIDINALPGLIPNPAENSRFPRACFSAGMSYNEIIKEIFEAALKRLNLKKDL